MLVHLNSWTSENCFNKLSDNYKFIIEPSERTIRDHLTDIENGYLKKWNELKDKQITFNEVVDLFHKNNKTPKWVDSSIYYSTIDLTIVHLFFSRQFKDENEIYYLDRGTGPFKAVVGIPPDNKKEMQGEKFDVNWKWKWDNEKKLKVQNQLKLYHKLISLIILPTCLFFFVVFGWSAFSTITKRSGLNGDMYSYYNLTRTTYSIYTSLVSLLGLGFTLTLTIYLIKSEPKKLTKAFWYFLIFIVLVIICELFLQTRFEVKA